MKGCFITLEGPEAGGKSTQVSRLKELLEAKGIRYTITREPGGTRIGDRLREILLDPDSKLASKTEILLYAASRAQLVDEVIRPALARGEVVICDRYVDSSIAYQAYGAVEDVDEVSQINKIATSGLLPDRTYLLDLPVEITQQRLLKRGSSPDRIEQRSLLYHQRVRQGYLTLARLEPDRIMIVDATQTEQDVFSMIKRDFLRLLSKLE